MSANPPRYSLIDVETANMIGVYRSQRAALRDVASTIRQYGRDSIEVLSLSLARDDVPADQGHIATGADLAARAAAAFPDAVTAA